MSSFPKLVDFITSTTDVPCANATAKQNLWQEAIGNPMSDFLGRKGKRIRADLIGIAYQIAGGKNEAPDSIIDFIELLHAGSLIIDDIQDNSRNRRRKETMHLKYGVPLAINTGNMLYFAALEKLAEIDLNASEAMEIMQKSLHVIRRCHEGQALDLTATFDQLPPAVIPDTVLQISQMKTGSLTALACWLGGRLAGGDAVTCERLSNFGMELGIGLQMQNDFVELQKAAFSRRNSDDLRNRRITWPWAWLAEAYPTGDVKALSANVCEQLPEMQQVAQQFLERIEIVAVNEINERLEGSIAILQSLDLDPAITQKLNQIIATLELRYV